MDSDSDPEDSIFNRKPKNEVPQDKKEINPFAEPEQTQQDPDRMSTQSKTTSYAKKMAMGGGGMGMPLIMPGMKLTKPS